MLPTSTSCRVLPGAVFFFLRRSSDSPPSCPRCSHAAQRRCAATNYAVGSVATPATPPAALSIFPGSSSFYFSFLIRIFFAFSFLSLARRWPAGRALLLVAELASTPAVQLASQRAARLCNGAQRPPSLSAITFSDVRCLLFCEK